MSTLLSCHKLGKAYGASPLFEDLDIHIGPKDRVGFIGANGSGKSTLMKILAGTEEPDSGQRMQRKDLRVDLVVQDPIFAKTHTVSEVLAQALEHHPADPSEGPVERQVRVNASLTRLGFVDPMQKADQLSGGFQKRLAIGQALVCEPELLLMDEPTNHLDLAGILWLERLLYTAGIAYMVVSHDRVFLEKVADTIIELDPRHPGGLLRVEGGYGAFLQKRAEKLAARAQHERSLANKVSRELEWLGRGPKARATKAAARIREAQELMAELDRLRAQDLGEAACIEMAATGRKSKRLMALRGVEKTLGERLLFGELSLLLRPGVRLGVLGANGSGKTTLLRILAGELAPDAGEIKSAQELSVVYFAQRREELKPELSLKRTLAAQGDSVIFQGRAQHVQGWARRFGFDSKQLEQPVGRLSGGEKAKVAIALLMLKPADVLLLDEPTNDLDIPTLEVLEESLLEFPGAVVLVTHDRLLLDRVCSVILGLDGRGGVVMVADCVQWESFVSQSGSAEVKKAKPGGANRPQRKKDMSYLDKRELEGMEQAILDAEQRLGQARAVLEDPGIASCAEELEQAHQQMLKAKAEVERLYDRWAELDAKRRDG